MSPTVEPLRDEGTRAQVILAGATAGLISRFCIAPLDVIKIRLQLHYHSLADPPTTTTTTTTTTPPHASRRPPQTTTGILLLARNILRDEGLAGFWKGNIPAEGLYLSYGAVQFLGYRSATQLLDGFSAEFGVAPLPGSAKSFLAGALAGTAATTLTYPLDLLRTRFAAQGTERVYDGLLASVRDITRNEGPRGFFRGLGAGVGQIVPYMGLFFALYEGFKPVLAGVEMPFGSGDAVAGVTASMLSKSAVFPLDTVRKRLQIQGPTRRRYYGGEKMPVYKQGVLRTVATILRKEGARGLYRGLTVSLFKAAPTSAITMWTYERALNVLRSADEGV